MAQVIFLTLCIGLLALAAVVVFSKRTPFDTKKYTDTIQKHLNEAKSLSQNSAVLRDSTVQIDKQLEMYMKNKLRNSDSFGDNLRKLEGKVSKDLYNSIWNYHKIRNRTVHENYSPQLKEVRLMANRYISFINKVG